MILHLDAVHKLFCHQLSLVCNVSLQIGLSIVPLLIDQKLIDLGVKMVGDRALLRKHCSPYKVSKE